MIAILKRDLKPWENPGKKIRVPIVSNVPRDRVNSSFSDTVVDSRVDIFDFFHQLIGNTTGILVVKHFKNFDDDLAFREVHVA